MVRKSYGLKEGNRYPNRIGHKVQKVIGRIKEKGMTRFHFPTPKLQRPGISRAGIAGCYLLATSELGAKSQADQGLSGSQDSTCDAGPVSIKQSTSPGSYLEMDTGFLLGSHNYSDVQRSRQNFRYSSSGIINM